MHDAAPAQPGLQPESEGVRHRALPHRGKALKAAGVLLGLLLPAGAQDDPRDSKSPFGVLEFLQWDHDWNHHHYPRPKIDLALGLMKEAGAGFVRMDFLWNDLEPAENTFAFEKYDALTAAVAKSSIRILGILCYNAAWSAPQWNAAPDRTRFVRFARATVRRYKDRVKYWEVWNEPDAAAYWQPQDGLKSYAALLKETYAALKAEDPGCRVLMGGLATPGAGSLDKIYQHGGKGAFDIVNIHPFIDPLQKDPIAQLRIVYEKVLRAMEAQGDGDREIWFTEIGCPGVRPPASPANWWLGRNPTEDEQARWVEAVYGDPLKWKGVRKIFWAFFRDTPGHFHGGVDHFGLVRNDFSRKPAFDAYRKAASR